MTLLVSGPARAEIRKARPQSITSLCELLSRYVDDESGNPAIGAVAPLTPTDVPDPTKDMMNKFAELIEGVQETQTRQMERVCAMLGTIAKDISAPAKAVVQPQAPTNPRQFPMTTSCTATTLSLTSTAEPEQAMFKLTRRVLLHDVLILSCPLMAILLFDAKALLNGAHGNVGDNLIDRSAAPEDWGDPEKNTPDPLNCLPPSTATS
ncbi:hypothetical protein FOZ60_012714 [Perkinsus olseni]|uniref:Uncharacterized protein n=1 Tax=Perkinsus olseni TaxID=32597 RepID=A0A7J6NAW3_PEROL|nr:hypothetical protein FOZ60_012714 [Perkinsus olseni]